MIKGVEEYAQLIGKETLNDIKAEGKEAIDRHNSIVK